MIGKHQLVFGSEDLIRGMSTSQHIKDGGYSNEESSVNLAHTPGLAYGPANTVDSDTDTALTDEIIASCPDHQTSGIENREVVTEDAKKYRYNGTKLGSSLDTDTSTYQKGFTDMVVYQGETYISSKEELHRWTGASTFDNAFQTFTNTASPHPLLVYEDALYAGDKNLLLRTTAAGTTQSTILTLDSAETIYALGIDRGTGRILISTKNILDVSNTLTAVYKLYWYDGNSDGVDKAVEVDDMITAFHNVGNVTYVGYGTKIGYISGSGIKFLRQLRNADNDSEDLPYKHNFANIGNTLYVVDEDQILAFGEVQAGGQKIWYYLYLNDITENGVFKAIFPAGNNKLGLSSPTSKFHTLDVSSIADTSNGLDISTNWYNFPRPVYLRGAWLDLPGSTNLSNVTLRYKYDDATGFRGLIVEGGDYTGAFEVQRYVGFVPNKVTAVQFGIAIASSNAGFRKLIVDYDFVE